MSEILITEEHMHAIIAREVADALAPAWTPGPPTEPGEWWIRDALSGAEFAAEVTAVSPTCVVWCPVGLPAYKVAWVPRWLSAHAPLLRPEPYREPNK